MTKKKDEVVEEVTEESVEETEEAVEQTIEEKLVAELGAQKEAYLRLAAEYDNFRKRTIKEKEESFTNAKSTVFADMLPVLDNFDRALGTEDASLEDFKKGVEMTYTQFLEVFKKYIKRDYVFLEECSYEDYLAFIKKHPCFIAKPDNDSGGKSIEAIDANEYKPEDLYKKLLSNRQTLLEEKIKQCDELSRLYPCSINTIRVVTINKNGNVVVPFVAIRIGNEGNVVDNFHSGGMFDVVDEDGVIRKPALNKANAVFDVHPYTGTEIIGFKIPKYDEILSLCKEMATVVPEIGYVGWDIAVSDKGLDVVEGNQLPGYDIYQSYPHLNEDLCGLKPKFDEIIFGKSE